MIQWFFIQRFVKYFTETFYSDSFGITQYFILFTRMYFIYYILLLIYLFIYYLKVNGTGVYKPA